MDNVELVAVPWDSEGRQKMKTRTSETIAALSRFFTTAGERHAISLSGMQESPDPRAHPNGAVDSLAHVPGSPGSAAASDVRIRNRYRPFGRIIIWLAVLLQAASIAYAGLPKSPYPPGPYNITVTYDTQGRPWQIVDGTTVLGEYAYNGDNVAPVAYTAQNGQVRWITDEDRVWIVAYGSIVTPTMTEADLDTLVTGLNSAWKTMYWRTTNTTPPQTHNTCIADCDNLWMKAASVCTLIGAIDKGWMAKCLAAVVAGDLVCKAGCPAMPPGPFEFIWCKRWPEMGAPAMNQHPENCGPDPTVLVTQGCAEDIDRSHTFRIYPGPISFPNGGFRATARCYWSPPGEPARDVGFTYVDYVAICNPNFYLDVAELWYTHPINTMQYVCSP